MTRGAALVLRDLIVFGEGGRRILDVPELNLTPGTALGISGPSGAGKSTLLYALAGMAAQMTGRIDWDGTEIVAQTPAQRARFRADRIGMIFQDHLLFEELSALGNAGLPALYAPKAQRRAIRDRAADRLAKLGIDAGTRRVASFSGGERQRVAVARAMAADAPILLADEPTASLHREAAEALADDLMVSVGDEGRTLVCVTHDERLLARMDWTLRVADGRVMA
ncbi:Lipoprotein-releasing system ATP-binding protein LolD [Rhodobacteraceae bacterium THAF1]|uniref:ABC transporter ATP-binding protein n=1 Tax=Palleronia sp. THAF1 TaxID=2587842 RepID=UPI000F41B3E9|nr:ATP-binding cassette domain-containing protein [Palleronia sp. THAF1]QFU09078.1 Lipoprotein-releasing system ATP-binding protein LolD [Palleronia sp. THAF1]VDC24121.1 Lipoprotein-releasing system ATP-binding protein LolD [Rhodobacteraceae bacterium THAF1]